jgi:hypothetical protein
MMPALGRRNPTMWIRKYQDALSGALLMAVGCIAAVYAIRTYDIGTLSATGPGMFPIALGLLLILQGGGIAAPLPFADTKR